MPHGKFQHAVLPDMYYLYCITSNFTGQFLYIAEMLTTIIKDPNENNDTTLAIKQEAIRNGYLFAFARSQVPFPFVWEIKRLRLGSSKSVVMDFKVERVEEIFSAGVADGLIRKEMIATFLSTWAGWDGSFLEQRFIVQDNKTLLFQPPAVGSRASTDIPSMQWIAQSLSYATETERII
jgi:hypothetical protein